MMQRQGAGHPDSSSADHHFSRVGGDGLPPAAHPDRRETGRQLEAGRQSWEHPGKRRVADRPQPRRRRLRSVAAYKVRGGPCATVHNRLVSPQKVRRRSVSCQSCSATANGIVAGQGPNWRKMCGSGVRVPTGRPRRPPRLTKELVGENRSSASTPAAWETKEPA